MAITPLYAQQEETQDLQWVGDWLQSINATKVGLDDAQGILACSPGQKGIVIETEDCKWFAFKSSMAHESLIVLLDGSAFSGRLMIYGTPRKIILGADDEFGDHCFIPASMNRFIQNEAPLTPPGHSVRNKARKNNK